MSTFLLCVKTFILWVIVGFLAVLIVFGTNIGEPIFTVSLSREVSIRSGDLITIPIGLIAAALTIFWYIRFLKKNPVS